MTKGVKHALNARQIVTQPRSGERPKVYDKDRTCSTCGKRLNRYSKTTCGPCLYERDKETLIGSVSLRTLMEEG